MTTTTFRKRTAVTNPFDDPDANYLVLVNDGGRHSLWPVFVAVRSGCCGSMVAGR